MDNEFLLTQIRGVLPTAVGFTIFLETGEGIYVVHIDKENGTHLVEALNGVEHARPFTHDLLVECLEGLGASVQRVIVHHVEDAIFHARVILSMDNELGHKVVEVDSRVSDALVLAIYSGCGVFTRRHILGEVEDVSEIIDDLLTRGGGTPEGPHGDGPLDA